MPGDVRRWARDAVAPGDAAVHPGGWGFGCDVVALHFCRMGDAAFLAAFPDLALADGTRHPLYTSGVFPGDGRAG